MTENKRFRTGKGIGCGDYFSETIIDTQTNEKYYGGIKPNYISSKQIVELLNQLCEEKEEIAYYHKRQVDDKIEYKIRVKKVLKRYYDNYTQMAVDLRDDKYANAMCHDVIEVLCEIADKLGVKLE